jgi:hypothetical protein
VTVLCHDLFGTENKRGIKAMKQLKFTLLLVSALVVISPLASFAVTLWAAAEYFDAFVDDAGDGVEAFTFEGRDALTGGGIYFTEDVPEQAATPTTYYEYDLGACPKDADGDIWYAWGRCEWTGGISGCNSFGLMWLQTNGNWTEAKNFGNDDPFLKPWHWKDIDGGATLPALSAGDPVKVRLCERESRDDEELTPLLDVFGLTTDASYRPQDDDVPELKPKPVEPRGKISTIWGKIKHKRN